MYKFDAKKLISLGNKQFLKSINIHAADPRSENLVKKAIRRYTLALLHEPENSVAFHNRGLAKQRGDDLKGAIADFQKAFELNTSESIIRKSLNEAHSEQRQKEKFGQTLKGEPALNAECLAESLAA